MDVLLTFPDAKIMVEDQIVEVGIDQDGKL